MENFRIPFIQNEYLVRYQEGTFVEWFLINLPEWNHDQSATLEVTCGHISSLLNRRKLYLLLDDTNGIGKLPYLARLILQDTGWTVGTCDIFLEADGTTEKIRSLKSDGKEGAYQLVTNLCNLFHARPIYHGDTKTVDFRAINNRESMQEFTYQKNLKSVRVEHSTESLITRMYVEGIYDDLGYIGIEDVNPTGLGFLLNFDYFRSVGLFTAEHEASLQAYLDAMQAVRGEIMDASIELSKKRTELNGLWGQCKYAVWPVLGHVSSTEVTIGHYVTNASDVPLSQGDEVVACMSGGTYIRTKVFGYQEDYKVLTDDPIDGATHIIRFLTSAAGVIGGKEVTIEAKEGTIRGWERKLEYTQDEPTRNSLLEQIQTTQQEINAILNGNSDTTSLYAQMHMAVALAVEINALYGIVTGKQGNQSGIERAFVDAMGDLLRDGYWMDSNYVKGQELALYTDALDMIETMSKPLVTYRIDYQDLSAIPAYADEQIEIDTAIRVYDPEINLNDLCFVTKITRCVDSPWDNKAEISNQIINIAGQTFDSILSRMAELSNQINGRKVVFERASIIGADGTLSTEVLNGIIDINRNMLLSTSSNWHTDENGNIIFLSHDGTNAMMLTGSGFMIASGKTDQGDWDWRTFGTGKGFTADEIVAGEIRTGLVRILGTDRFFWDAANIYILDPLNMDRQIRIGLYDGINNGIGFTQDGGRTWQNAIGFNGVNLSTEQIKNIVSQVQTELGGITLSLQAPDGMYLDDQLTAVPLHARVFRNGYDITDEVDASNFNWQRKSHRNETGDAAWNAAHTSMKSIAITGSEVDFHAVFSCTLKVNSYTARFSIENGQMMQEDGSDTTLHRFSLEDGNLYVDVPNVYSMDAHGNLLVSDSATSELVVYQSIVNRESDPYVDALWTKFELTDQQIALRASKTEVDDLSDAVSRNTADIIVNADNISLKVSRNEFIRSDVEPASAYVQLGTIWYDLTRNTLWECISLAPDPGSGTNHTWIPVESQVVRTSGVSIDNSNIILSSPNILFELLDPLNPTMSLAKMNADVFHLTGRDGRTKLLVDLQSGNLTLEGVINAIGGSFGGFVINEEGISSPNITISSNGYLKIGDAVVGLKGGFTFGDEETPSFAVNDRQIYLAKPIVIKANELPTTTMPPNLYLDPNTGRLHLSTWEGSVSGLTLSASVSKYSANVGESVTVYAQASNGTTPYTYRYNVFVNGVQRAQTGFIASSSYNYTLDTSGNWEFYVEARDSAGKSETADAGSVYVQTQQSNMSCTVSVSPSTTVSPGTYVTWTGTAYNAVNPVTWSYKIYGPGGTVWYTGSSNSAGYTLSQAQSTWFAEFTARDATGNTKVVQSSVVSVGSGSTGGKQGTITGDSVRIRSSMSAANDSNVIGFLYYGNKVEILGGPTSSGGYTWYYVRTISASSLTGYVASNFISL